MKKIFSLLAVLAMCFTANAADWYYAGDASGWANNSETFKFQGTGNVLTLDIADLWGTFKLTNGSWHPQYGAAADGEGIKMGGSYTLVKCDDSNGEADAPANANIIIEQEGDYRYKNAKLSLDVTNPDKPVITLVSGELYDHSAAPVSYYLIGACTSNWELASAVEFVDVNGVLTANVEDLNGTFKVIYDRAWGTEYCSNSAGLTLGEDYKLILKGDDYQFGDGNISLANPFGGYKNAVLTLTINGDDHILKLVSGEFYISENNWYFPGTKIGWNCNETTQFEPVAGKENTYEYLAAEFGGDFKVVYGVWAVEFGANNADDKWEINKPYLMTYPCAGNFNPASEEVYQDVTITIVVDYEKAEVELTISPEGTTAVENVTVAGQAQKRIENGQLVIEKNGVKYNVLGAEIK